MLETLFDRYRRTLRLLTASLLLLAASIALPASAPANSSFSITTIFELDYPLQPGEYVWDDAGVPPGRVRIAVDLDAEMLYVYRSGVEIGRAAIIYGADHKPTPTGRFTILQKSADHVSNIYHVPMPYMLRLTWSGIAIHGSDVEDGLATHGCVGIPLEFAELLFAAARLGDQVIVTTGWRPDLYG